MFAKKLLLFISFVFANKPCFSYLYLLCLQINPVSPISIKAASSRPRDPFPQLSEAIFEFLKRGIRSKFLESLQNLEIYKSKNMLKEDHLR